MNKIYKHSLKIELIGQVQYIYLPEEPKILDADFDEIKGEFTVWVMVNPEKQLIKKAFWILKTGMSVPETVSLFGKHLQTRKVKSEEFHIFYV